MPGNDGNDYLNREPLSQDEKDALLGGRSETSGAIDILSQDEINAILGGRSEASGTTEVLSQSEIDDTLKAISGETGDIKPLPEPRRNIKIWDFRRPDIYTKQIYQDLIRIHQKTANSFILKELKQTRYPLNLSFFNIDRVTFEEYIRSIPSMTYLFSTTLFPGGQGRVYLNIPPYFANSIISGAFGIQSGNENYMKCHCGTVSLSLITKLAESLLESIAESWSSRFPCRMGPVKMTSSPFDERPEGRGTGLTVVYIKDQDDFASTLTVFYDDDQLREFRGEDLKGKRHGKTKISPEIPLKMDFIIPAGTFPRSSLETLKEGSVLKLNHFNREKRIKIKQGEIEIGSVNVRESGEGVFLDNPALPFIKENESKKDITTSSPVPEADPVPEENEIPGDCSFVNRKNCEILPRFLADEHPAVSAAVLSMLPREIGGHILPLFNPEEQKKLIRFLLTMGDIPDGLAGLIRQKLYEYMKECNGLFSEEGHKGGISTVEEVLGQTDLSTEQTILKSLEGTIWYEKLSRKEDGHGQ